MDALHQLTDADLAALAAALRSGRLLPPYELMSVRRYCPSENAPAIAAALHALAADGFRPEQAALVGDAIVRARATRLSDTEMVDLVWTGPETAGAANRDTAVVVRELFAQAIESVVVAGFAVYQGRTVFRGLAERMAMCQSLRARLYLNVHRGYRDIFPDAEIVAQFALKFVAQDWPAGFPRPEVYYDPRSLSLDPAARSSLHAKCVVVDRRVAFVTSANFTEAAQERNIEAGVVIRSPRLASRLADHFAALVEGGRLCRLDVPSCPTRKSGVESSS